MSTFTKKKLILVGNKPPKRVGLRKIIDSFDYVLRISRMNYLYLTGNKIDGIYLEANTVFKNIFNGGKHKDKIKIAKNIFMHKYGYNNFKEWKSYLTEQQYENIEIVSFPPAIEAINFDKPTSPILILVHLLNSEWKDLYDIYITCLDVENRDALIDNNTFWELHKGGGFYEKNYLMKLIQDGTIQRIADE